MAKILQFKSCVYGNEFVLTYGATTGTYYIAPGTSAAFPTQVANAYASDANLAGKVTGIGYGWQQYIVENSGTIKFTVRGAAGGHNANSGSTIDPVTGATTGSATPGGRGAKLVGTAKLKKGDILYLLVGCRGWCNVFADWGGGGGGASVVCIDNPLGAYTLTPVGRKVDVLFVAGGGGGAGDNALSASARPGQDAVLSDGTTTNGGSSSKAAGGGGLTGQGTNASVSAGGGRILLSGAVNTTSLSAIHYGGWGGGGASYNGGGGGGGYSGGNASDSTGGRGGTSYINPTLCIELFRGYATVAEDGHRNLVNPWSAYGFIELEIGRDETKNILALDSDGYKWFNGTDGVDGSTNLGASNTWELLTDQSTPTDTTFDIWGKRVITNVDGLQDQVRFLVRSSKSDEAISISGMVNGAILEMTKDKSLADVSTLTSITAATTLNNLDVRFAISKNYGQTWQTYSAGQWVDIDIANKTDFQTLGYELSLFSTIPITDWNSYNAKVIRFAFCITQNGIAGQSFLDSIDYVCDLVGSWRRFTEAQATYEYISDSQVKVTFFETGNYKVNYLDELTTT